MRTQSSRRLEQPADWLEQHLQIRYHGNCPELYPLPYCSSLSGGAGVVERGKSKVVPQSALDGREWSASRPGQFTPGAEPPVPIG
jgi:hypothetical protein